MIPRPSRRLAAVAVCLAALFLTACEKVPLLAPTGSSITLTTATSALPANGTATIIAQVLEAAGTPPHSGTRITFTTTLGTIEPSEASTDISGRATVTFRAGGASGIAIIAAASGGATTSSGTTAGTGTTTGGTTTTTGDRSLKIAVGTAAVGRVNIAANPAMLPTAGGVSTISANILDINGNPLSSAPVTFTTTAGSLSANTVTTDANGNASVSLTTFQQAVVTATVGLSSTSGSTGSTGSTGGTQTGSSNTQATVTVSLTNSPTISITGPTTPPSAGLPSSYTIKVTPATTGSTGGSTGSTGSTIAIKEVVISWGDGITQNLGGITGDQAVSHVYSRADTYTITATVTDVAGGTARVSTSVTVIPVPRPTVIVTPTPQSAPGGATISFNIQITAASGLAIQNVQIDFGDGQTQSFGGATGNIVTTHAYAAGPRTVNVTVTVIDSTGQTTTGTATVSITT